MGMLLPTWQYCWGFKETTYIKCLVGEVQRPQGKNGEEWFREASWEGSGSTWPLALVEHGIHQKKRLHLNFLYYYHSPAVQSCQPQANEWVKCDKYLPSMLEEWLDLKHILLLELFFRRQQRSYTKAQNLEDHLWTWISPGYVLFP